jgi:hypothetical protein
MITSYWIVKLLGIFFATLKSAFSTIDFEHALPASFEPVTPP